MPVGGCFCGNIRIEYSGQPLSTALCHCLDCRKLTGAAYTYNVIVKTAELRISGSPKEVAKISESGKAISNWFCPDCGTPLFGRKKSPGEEADITIVRAGILDDVQTLNELKPDLEIYTDRRLEWIGPKEGAAQFSGMLPPTDLKDGGMVAKTEEHSCNSYLGTWEESIGFFRRPRNASSIWYYVECLNKYSLKSTEH